MPTSAACVLVHFVVPWCPIPGEIEFFSGCPVLGEVELFSGFPVLDKVEFFSGCANWLRSSSSVDALYQVRSRS